MITKWEGAKDWYQLLIAGQVAKEGEDIAAELCILARQYGPGAIVHAVKHPKHGYEPFGFHYSASEPI